MPLLVWCNKRPALVTGGSIVFELLAATVQVVLERWPFVEWPSFCFWCPIKLNRRMEVGAKPQVESIEYPLQKNILQGAAG